MSNPEISIVMPAYGVEKYISAAIESVLKQDFQDWELLVVLDGIKDKSDEVAREYEQKDSRIKVLEKENGGLSDARNYGLDRAVGEYVHFFDSDDTIEPDFYSRMHSAITTNNKDLVICGYYVDTESGDTTTLTEHKFIDCLEPVPAKFDLNLVGQYVNFAWNKLFKREFLVRDKLYYQKGLFGYEDVEFMSRYMQYHPDIMFISYLGYHYFNRQRETLSRIFDQKLVERAAGNLQCYRTLLSSFSIDKNSIDKAVSQAVLGAYKALFPLVFEQKQNRLNLIRWVLNEKSLFELLPAKIDGNIMDKVFCFLIRYRLSTIIFLYYKFR
ncbi:MAG: glycosyltransferase family 2 protein [Bacteroidales bacterium]|nr:glycosyltransferase family 2 protein [Bacteroidales bacterium]